MDFFGIIATVAVEAVVHGWSLPFMEPTLVCSLWLENDSNANAPEFEF